MRRQSDHAIRLAKGDSRLAAGEFLESLEPRCLLSQTSPFPDAALLESPGNSVARITTNFGDIDIELFDYRSFGSPDGSLSATLDNFREYIEDGDYDQFFFHQLLSGFVLRGGGFRYDDANGLTPVPTEAPIVNNFLRSNVARTVAMAKGPFGEPDSAQSQFLINLADNSGSLDTPSGGYTVFGRVIGDAAWNVVQTIAGLSIQDLRADPKFAGPLSENFASVPVSGAFDPVAGPTEATLVLVHDIEIIKPSAFGHPLSGVPGFYDEFLQYPDGFAGATINEFLPIGNPSDTEWVRYQVIARAETPQGLPSDGYTWFRDRVIATGILQPLSRGGITISQFGEGGVPNPADLVPQGVPYALEVRATGPIAVNFSHYDFGSATGENFVSQTSQTWTFADASKLAGSVNQFLVWYNPDASPVNVSVTFTFDDGTTQTTTTQTDRLRRGGLDINDLGIIPDNTSFSIQVSADRPIVAALTGFDTRGDQTGFTELGAAGAGSTRGVLPMGNASATAQQFVAFYNPSATDSAPITLAFSYSDGTPDKTFTLPSLSLAAGGRAMFNVGDLPEVNDGRRFTLRYSSGAVPIYAHARNVQFTDEVRYPVGLDAATRWHYGEGFLDPARAGVDVFETLSIFNPNFGAMGRADASAQVEFHFKFIGGGLTDFVAQTSAVAPGGRLDIDLHTLQTLIDRITLNGQFFYSIEVVSDVPVVSQFWHHDLTLGGQQPSGGFGELGAPRGDIVRLG